MDSPNSREFVTIIPSCFIRITKTLVFSARNGNLEVPVYFLKAKQRYTVRKKEKIYVKFQISVCCRCRYEIQEQKEVPVWCTGLYRPISSTACIVTLAASGNGCAQRTIGYALSMNRADELLVKQHRISDG
jgi:hypothetical protein